MTEDQESRAQTIDGNEGPADSIARPLRSRADVVAELVEFIAHSPQIFGAGDILNIDSLHPIERAGILAAILTGVVMTGERGPAVRAFVVVSPPETDVGAAHSQAWSAILATFQLIHDQEMPADAQAWYKARFKVIAAADLRISSLLAVIAEQPEQAAVIVTDAARYRGANIGAYIGLGDVTPLLPEDIWVPQVHALATAAIEVARDCSLYVALDTGQQRPTRAALRDLLTSVDGWGVMGSSNDQDLWAHLGEKVALWDQWIREGQLGKVLHEIQELPPVFEANKPFLRIQMLHKAGFFDESLHAIREELARGREIDAPSRVIVARIAQDAGASRLALEVLNPAIDQLDSMEHLESALATAHDTGYGELEERVASRLAMFFPDSRAIRARRERIMAAARDYGGIAEMLIREEAGQARANFFRELSQFLSGTETPDYLALIASAGGDRTRSEAFRMACVQDALQRGLILHAFELALPLPETSQESKGGERLLVRVLEAIFLWATKGTRLISDERIESAVLSLIKRLASDPTNQSLRTSLTALVQPSISGVTGLALMAGVVLKLASSPIKVTKRKLAAEPQMDWLAQNMALLQPAFSWLKDQAPVVIGRVTLPEGLLTESPDKIVSAVTEYLNYAPVGDEKDVAALRLCLTFATCVTPHCTDPDRDIQLMRLVGGKLASSGYAQMARDLMEQTLLNSAASPRRRRLGWFAMADVYHRCHNYLESLSALGCALATDVPIDEEQSCFEASLLARLFRDCGLYDLARTALGECRQRLADMGLSESNGHRLDMIELQIRSRELNQSNGSTPELETLMQDVVRHGEAVLERDEDTEPAALLVGQMINFAKKRGAKIPSNAGVVFAQLREHVRGNLASVVAAISTESVSAMELLNLVKMRDSARYSDDVGYDMRDVATVASRALADDKYIQNAVETSFALELTADYGVAIPGWDEAPKPPLPPQRVEQSAEIASAVSRDGVSVVQVGFDSNGQLVRLSAVDGLLSPSVREPPEIMHEERFRTWALQYPYEYGIDESSPNLFYTTTADLRLSDLPEGPVVIAADATFQPFPPNIFFLGDDFAGRTRPMAAVPSLAWLKAAQEKDAVGDGRLCAWISTAVSDEQSEALPMIAERLKPTFTEYGFVVDNGPNVPKGFKGATLAVITAHGGIHRQEGFFRVVSDEGSLRVTANALAAALRNVGTVVLFVCSGGRADKHPDAQTTLGLAKQILDWGAQAVIASPWPLDSRVPSHWLPAFLEQWAKGEPLIQANFAANRIVDCYFALDPARGLAMTVIGNPMARRVLKGVVGIGRVGISDNNRKHQ